MRTQKVEIKEKLNDKPGREDYLAQWLHCLGVPLCCQNASVESQLVSDSTWLQIHSVRDTRQWFKQLAPDAHMGDED